MKSLILIMCCVFLVNIVYSQSNISTYDSQSRLTQTTLINGVTYEYTYDKLGNRISKTIVGKSLKVSATLLAIAAAANSTANFTISSNQNWNINSSQSWLSPNVSSGSNNQTITLTATQNSGTNSREATITVSAPGITPHTIVVTQAGTENILEVSPTNISLASTNGSSATFDISSTIFWEIDNAVAWLDLSAISGNCNQQITVTANSENTSAAARTTTLIVFSEDADDVVIEVTQLGSSTPSYLSLSNSELSISGNSGANAAFSISSNVSWTLSTNAWWLNLSSTSGSNNASITCTAVAENSGTEARSGTVYAFIDGVSAGQIVVTQEPFVAQNLMTYVPDDSFEQALIDLGYDTGELNDSVPTQNINTIISLTINGRNIDNLTGIEDFTLLEILNCTSNQLSDLDLSRNKSLKKLYCVDNQLSSLNVSANDSLIELWCYLNPLSILDVSNNTALQKLYCENTQITELDVRNNNQLTTIDCQDNNQLTRLNLKNGNNTNFVMIRANDNPNLTCVTVDDPAYSETNWGGNFDVGVEFSTNCNGSNIVYIPDANFKTKLVGNPNINTNGDTEIQYSEAEAFIGSIDVSNSWDTPEDDKISDLTGIEAFTSILSLDCEYNLITSLDLSSNTSLQQLHCGVNNIISIDVSNSNLLTVLHCHSNAINSIDISNNTFLVKLDCGSNQLTGLDVSNNSTLEELWCYSNSLSSLNLSSNLSLTHINCRQNQLTSLDVSLNTALEYLNIGENQLSAIDISNNTLLTEFGCWSNQLTSLDISNNLQIEKLKCDNNQLTGLNVSPHTNLVLLECFDNQLTELDLSNNHNLKALHCYDNSLSILNLANGNNDNMQQQYFRVWRIVSSGRPGSFNASNNPNLTCIQVDDPVASESYDDWQKNETASYSTNCNGVAMTYVPDDNFEQALIDLGFDSGELNDSVPTENINSITVLNVDQKNISDLTGIEDFSNLRELYCGNNEITSLDLSSNNELRWLSCLWNDLTTININGNVALIHIQAQGNNLSTLDVSTNVALEYFNCSYNQLMTLDLGANIALESLGCYGNQISTLDLSANTALTELVCYENLLTTLDVGLNLALEVLSCSDNLLTSLDVSLNTNLQRLYCDDNQLTALDVSLNSALTQLECYNNQLTTLDLSSNTAFTRLQCYNNLLTSLNIQNGNNGNMNGSEWYQGFDATNNPNLSCIQVDDPVASEGYADWQKDETASYSYDCGGVVVPVNLSIDNLTLANSESNCYNAENEITVAGNGSSVSLENGSEATFIAGQSIRFLPGFHAQSGSYVSAYITTDGSFCDMVPQSLAQNVYEPEVLEKSVILKNDELPLISQGLKVYPNPTNGMVTIVMENFGDQKLLEIANISGQTVYKQIINDVKINIDISAFNKGLYIVTCSDRFTRKAQRVVLN